MGTRLKNARKNSVIEISYIAVFAALISVCAWISIPTPTSISFTLQTFGVFVTVGLLGGKRGTLAVLVYLFLGAVGAPVFSGFSGGIGHLLGMTGGYIVGFLFSALIMWAFEKMFGNKTFVMLMSMILGLAVCYAFGTLWFVSVYARTKGEITFAAAFMTCVAPYLVFDGLKIALALFVTKSLKKYIKL